MRASGIIAAMILAIALYFTLFWGFDALRILTSPTYGLDDVWRSQIVFGLGRLAGFGPEGLIKLAAVIGALKLTVAGVCAVHVLDRFRSLIAGQVQNEILESGLLIAVLVTIGAVAPALWSGNADLVRELTIQLLLAGLASALCIIERSRGVPKEDLVPALADGTELPLAEAGRGRWFMPWKR
ncbi:MAG: hypothetical protein JOZ70_03515 [Pseudolabrys sp.]|nr:hypothetical protein [Pseudolabrys sp.]